MALDINTGYSSAFKAFEDFAEKTNADGYDSGGGRDRERNEERRESHRRSARTQRKGQSVLQGQVRRIAAGRHPSPPAEAHNTQSAAPCFIPLTRRYCGII